MGHQVTLYTPSRNYFWAGFAALVMAAFSYWCATRWSPAALPAVLLTASAVLLLYLSLRPAVEVNAEALVVGSKRLAWNSIRSVDRTGWISPLVLRISMDDGAGFFLIYPGNLDSANSLLRHIRRNAREALLDGVPYRQFWGDEAPAIERRQMQPPKYQLLRAEDEAEVERLFQRLKTVGHIDPKNPDEQ